MSRYILPAFLACLVVLFSWVFSLLSSVDPKGELQLLDDIGSAVLPIALWVAAIWTCLLAWGILGAWLSRKREKLAVQAAEVPMGSWHFRLNKWVDGYGWSDQSYAHDLPGTECEYWAYTASSILSIGPLHAVVVLVGVAYVTVARVAGWFFGYMPRFTDLDVLSYELALFERETSRYSALKRQNVGPTVGKLMIVLLLVGVPLILFGWEVTASAFGVVTAVFMVWLIPISWLRSIGRFILACLRPTLRVASVVAVAAVSPFRWVLSLAAFLLVRTLACREVHYVE